jgi:hypothetical protein
MGYTHYLYRPEKFPKKKWKDFTKELEMLAKNLPAKGITAGSYGEKHPIILCGWNEKSKEYERGFPIVCDDGIAFNGEGDFGHESFWVPQNMGEEEKKFSSTDEKTGLRFSFCKTARKPYDTMVCLALISMKRWFMNDVIVSSDGDKEDWEPALELYTKLTGIIINWDILTYDPSENDKK